MLPENQNPEWCTPTLKYYCEHHHRVKLFNSLRKKKAKSSFVLHGYSGEHTEAKSFPNKSSFECGSFKTTWHKTCWERQRAGWLFREPAGGLRSKVKIAKQVQMFDAAKLFSCSGYCLKWPLFFHHEQDVFISRCKWSFSVGPTACRTCVVKIISAEFKKYSTNSWLLGLLLLLTGQ